MSLWGGLLRLMMAGLVFAITSCPVAFIALISIEIHVQPSSFIREGLRMIKKVLFEITSFAKRIVRNAIISWEARPPSGQSPLTSL